MSDKTLKERFNDALKATRKRGVRVRQNVSGCCRSCISYDAETKLGIKDREHDKLVWTYGGQGGAYSWTDDGEGIVYRSSRHGAPVDRIYFNHANGGADVLAEELRACGFTVEWDGSDIQTVTVVFGED